MEITRPSAMICRHCEQGDQPVLLVVYSKARHEFQFLCGADGHNVADADPIHADHVFNDDPSLVPLAYVHTPFVASRAEVGHRWDIMFVTEEYLDEEI